MRLTRRIINILELGFARPASKLAALPVPDAGRDETPVEFQRDECRMTSHAARTAVTVGDLEAQLPGSIEALVDGSIGMSPLGWMADTAHRLALSTSATAGFDEDHLLGKAKHLSVQRFRRECKQVIHAADHAAFVADQVAGVDARRMKLTTFDDGAVHLDAFLDPEGGAIVCTAIEPFARRKVRMTIAVLPSVARMRWLRCAITSSTPARFRNGAASDLISMSPQRSKPCSTTAVLPRPSPSPGHCCPVPPWSGWGVTARLSGSCSTPRRW